MVVSTEGFVTDRGKVYVQKLAAPVIFLQHHSLYKMPQACRECDVS
jgi:hypothetical protein